MLKWLRRHDATAPAFTPHYVFGRAYITVLAGVVAAVSQFGIPIPHFERLYDVLGWTTVASLVLTFVKPNNVLLRRVSVGFIILSMGTRATWWAIFSRFAYHPHTHIHFGLGSSILEFFVYSAVAFGALMSVVQAEAIERMHG